MKTINLKEYYPDLYRHDEFIEVPDEIAEALCDFERKEENYARYIRYHKAYYSLDCGDGIERADVNPAPTPSEIYEREQDKELLYDALSELPETQRRRIIAHYLNGMSYAAIARAEGVNESKVRKSIEKALGSLNKKIKNIF